MGRSTVKSGVLNTTVRWVCLLTTALVLGLGIAAAPGSAMSGAIAAESSAQCNSVFNTPGLMIECDVTVTNSLDVATGVSSATVESVACNGAANTPEPLCTTTIDEFDEFVGTVNQCNSSVNGGGANVVCDVLIVNNIVGASTESPSTVNQCIGSGGGGGTEPTVICAPVQSTTNATITQCNGSANEGGGTGRVQCTVDPSTDATALPVTVNQCNDSANGGGSTVICTVEIRNVITPAGDDGTPGDGAPEGIPGTPVLEDGVPTAPPPPGVPDQLAATGAGDASAPLLIALIALLLGGSAVVLANARRRHASSSRN